MKDSRQTDRQTDRQTVTGFRAFCAPPLGAGGHTSAILRHLLLLVAGILLVWRTFHIGVCEGQRGWRQKWAGEASGVILTVCAATPSANGGLGMTKVSVPASSVAVNGQGRLQPRRVPLCGNLPLSLSKGRKQALNMRQNLNQAMKTSLIKWKTKVPTSRDSRMGAESTKALYGESQPDAVELQRIYEDAKAKLEEANAQARQAALEEKLFVDQFRSLQDRLREKKRQFDKSQLDIQSQKERIKEVQKELEEAQEELGRRQSRHGELEKEIRELESTLAVKGAAAAAASIPGASIHEGIKQLVRTHLGQLGPEECISSESDLLLRGAADCLWGAIQKVGQQIQESAKRVGPEAKEGAQGQGNGGTPGQLDEQMGEKQSRKLEQHLEQTKQLFERLEREMGDEQKAKRVKAIVEEVLAIALPVADECL